MAAAHPNAVQAIMRHSTIVLTMDTYGHLFEGSDRDSAEKMERLFGTPSAPAKNETLRSLPRIALVPRKVS